jgi:hypothetical protein
MPRKNPSEKPAGTLVPLAEARIALDALIERMHTSNERFILEKDGLPVAALMDIDEFEDYLELHDPEVTKAISESREEYLAGKSRPAEELLRELEEEEERERQPRKPKR